MTGRLLSGTFLDGLEILDQRVDTRLRQHAAATCLPDEHVDPDRHLPRTVRIDPRTVDNAFNA